MDIKGKTKDNLNARMDLKSICNRPELELDEHRLNVMPKAAYTLMKEQKRRKLIPIAFHEMLFEHVWSALTEVSLLLQSVCSTKLNVHKLHELENSVALILCNLEKIFPPAFFNSMEPSLFTAHPRARKSAVTLQYFESDVQSKQTMPRRNDERTNNDHGIQTERHNTSKSTVNYSVCVKSSSYADEDNDFYKIIEEIIQLRYPLIPNLHIVLFKCRWVDPVRGMKVHLCYHLVDVNFKKLYQKDETLILAQQAVQVYFTEYPSMKRDKAVWIVVAKVKARRVLDESKWTEYAHINRMKSYQSL
ncbi:UNVERIFIED_CONTAM: hypothetical protein Slati_3829400 [Sesamum latifolium]|uniref:DUF4216 domain-containing protein n=1 Tax=Sesamum latifolium TaxID=2727402 RepID=A0AAW2TK21_9LAMI